MAQIFVYNPAVDRVERYVRGESEPMPYSLGRTLSVAEFRGRSNSTTLWTDRRTMEAWNTFRQIWGRSIYVGAAFKRIWEGGHADQSQHYAGVSFDVGQTLTATERNALRNAAVASGVWSYVEPGSLTPGWVHFDKRLGPPACAEGGFPMLVPGNKGVYVFILQDALNALGYTGSGLDGVFGGGTQRALMNFQAAQGLMASGIADCGTWVFLTSKVNGIGRTSTVVSP